MSTFFEMNEHVRDSSLQPLPFTTTFVCHTPYDKPHMPYLIWQTLYIPYLIWVRFPRTGKMSNMWKGQYLLPADSSKYWPFFKILYRLPEGLERVLKKVKSSEFNPRNYEQVQSSPSQKVWLHKSIKDAVKLPKNLILSQKRKIFKNKKEMLGPKQKYF